MDQEELRLNCLRMAYELGGKTDAIICAANELMSFVTKGPTTADARASAPEAGVTEGVPSEVTASAAEPAATDRIAACGTALEMPESGDLAQAEPAVEVMAAAEAEPVAPAEVTEAPSKAPAEEAATIAAPTVGVEATEPAAEPSLEAVESLAEATNGGSAEPAAAPEVEGAAVAAELVASASEEVVPSSEEHAPVANGSGQEHTAI
jgi:hypothetical protein